MGKKKQGQRTKNNAVPASSGRSAELLQSSSGVPFVGFSTLKNGGFIPILSGISDELDGNINEDFRLVWKKMNKKDTTTKLKALDEFKKLCQETDVETLKPVLPYWPRLFSSLSTDEEHRVREAAHAAHRALVAKAGRNIAPFLKQLVGPWFTGQHDTYPPAASTAETSFQEAFPPNKLVEAIIFCQEEIFNYISNNLLNQTAQTLANNPNSSQEVKDARYQRVVVSCLNGYALYLQRLPLDHLHKMEEANRKLISSAKFWKFSKDTAPIVRAAWFSALVELCKRAPFLLKDEAKHVCMTVFTNIDETDPAAVRVVWNTVLLTFSVVEDVWQHVSLEKLVLPKLWKVLREGADGNASLVYPNLLPLLSKIPLHLLPDNHKFFSKFFENLRMGLNVRNIHISNKESTAVITAFLECFRHLTVIHNDNDKLCSTLFKEQVLKLMEAVILDSKLVHARPCLFGGLATMMNTWSKQPTTELHSKLVAEYWIFLNTTCQVLLTDHITDADTLAANCASLEIILTASNNPDYQARKSLRVKFTSPKTKVEDLEESCTLMYQQCDLTPLYISECSKFVQGQIGTCLDLMNKSSKRARAVLVAHLAQIMISHKSPDMLRYMLDSSKLSWAQFYQQVLARWLRDPDLPLQFSLKIIFSLLEFVQDVNDIQTVYDDLSGKDAFAVCGDKEDLQLEPLTDKWKDILEWALYSENQTECVKQWLKSHEGVCRLASLLHREDPSYIILHNCLRNLRHNNWLTTECLGELVKSLRHNLIEPLIDAEVKTCSGNLLHAMLQNTGNGVCLIRLPAVVLRSMLYELFVASLQRLEHWPPASCWHHCLGLLAAKPDSDLDFSAIIETCVDLMLATICYRSPNLLESQQLMSVLEDLVQADMAGQGAGMAELITLVLNRLAAGVRQDAQAVWGLHSLVGYIYGTDSIAHDCCSQSFTSSSSTDPLAGIPLQQYITSMIPFLMIVVRLHTASQADGTTTGQLPYVDLQSTVPQEDLWDWTLQVLQLQSLCVTFKTHFANSKQYFLLKEKITFILEECGLFTQLKVKNIINHLDLSSLEEQVNSLQSYPLSRLQKHTVLKDLDILFNKQQILKNLIPFKAECQTLKHNFSPEETLAELASKQTLERDELPIVNICCRRSLHLRADNYAAESDASHITVLDRVFDLYVAEQKENRSLMGLSHSELNHIAEVADFACHSVNHDSVHMQQSSWDACLVATAALTLSVRATISEWAGSRLFQDSTTATASVTQALQQQDWPMSLLTQNKIDEEKHQMNSLSLAIIRVVCSVCRLFDAVSANMESVDPEDKAAITRRAEWCDVFLHDSHTAVTQSWLAVAELPLDSPALLLLVETISSSVSRFVQYPHCVEGEDTLGCLDTCCRLLQASNVSVQLAAYELIIKLIPAMVALDMKESEQDNIALSCQHVDKTMVYTQSIIDIILSGLSFGDTCIVEPFTDSYTYARCYLLLWSALLELCTKACSQLRALYTTWLKEEYLSVFMKTVFCLMPEAALHGEITSQRISQYFSKCPQLHKGVWGSDRLAQLSCWSYACALRRLPAAVRQWWNEAEHRIYGLVEHVTATYVSPDLVAEEMKAIQVQEKKFENMTVTVHPISKEVYAVYTLEESRMELVIELAYNHPLGLVKVRSGQRMVSTAQTRQWLLQINIFLTHQNGSIWDALELWKTSLDKRFEGVEECYICFAILHSVSHQLPKLSCQTCRKKFHSHCLYKWFTTSNKSTCPICRNLF